MTSGDTQQIRPLWPHVAVSAAVGALIVPLAMHGVVVLAFGAVVHVAFYVAIAFVVFAAVGGAFYGRPHGWRQGLTALVWAPVVAGAFLGENDLSHAKPLTYAAGATVAGIAALLMHEGRPRVVGGVVGMALTVGTIVMVNHRDHAEDRRAAIVTFGSSVRPWVIGLDGYRQHGDPNVVGPQILVTSFYRPEQVNQPELSLTVTTDASTTTVCGARLRATMGADFEQPQRTCEQAGGIWRRTSRDGHEVALVKGDRIVRVAASDEVTERELVDAMRSARPMSDRYYRHALFGEEGEYIPELDGVR